MNQKFEPVPIPLKQRLRELRVKVLPLAVFLIAGIVVASLWTQRTSSPDFVGQVYAEDAVLRAPSAGIVTGLTIAPFSTVKAGDVIGRILVVEPSVIEANLAFIRAEMEYLRISREPEVDRQRNRLNYEQMQLDLLSEKLDLASLNVRKTRARQALNRITPIWERGLESDEVYEQAVAEFELLDTEVREKEQIISGFEDRLRQFGETFRNDDGEESSTMAAINVQAERLRVVEAEMMPRELIAPVDGVVRLVHSGSGVSVTPGDTVAYIEASEPDFIIGYVRQPFARKPEPGMEVVVRSRSAGRSSYTSSIVSVGGRLSIIAPELQRPGLSFESGIPVKIAISEDATHTPGEIVDLILR